MLHCIIVSPDSKQEFSDVASVTLPGWWGQLQVLPHHAESFVVLRKGEVILENADDRSTPVKICIEGGVGHIWKDVITLIL